MSPVHDATAIIRDRRRRVRRRRWLVGLVAFLLLALLGAAIWLVYFSSVLALRTVAITGTEVLSPATVEQVAQAPVGRPLIRVQEREVAERIATLREVDQVTVNRRWPNTLEVKVVERKPVFALRGDNGWKLVDTKGVAYTEVAERPKELLRVSAPEDPLVLTEVAKVVSQLSPSLRAQASEARARTRDTVEVVVLGRRTVRFGSGGDMALKNQVAELMLAQTAFGFIDVSAPGHPVGR